MTQLLGGSSNWDRVPDIPAPCRKAYNKEPETGDTKRNYPNHRIITYHVPGFLRFDFSKENGIWPDEKPTGSSAAST